MKNIGTKGRMTVIGLSILAVVLMANWFPLHVYASGSAAYQLNPTSSSYTVGSNFTLTVYEYDSQSADNVEGVQAYLSYNAADLQCNSVDVSSSPFTYQAQHSCSGGSIQIAEAAGTSVGTGQVLVGTVSFTVIGTSGANPSTVGITSSSDIQSSSMVSVWNGVQTSVSYTLLNSSPGGGATGGSTGGSIASTSSTKKSTSTGGGTTTPAPASPTPPAKTTTANAPTKTIITNTLSIKVVNSKGLPLKDAIVVLDNKRTLTTNTQGTVLFSGVSGGTHRVSVHGAGIQTYTELVTLGKNQNKLVDLTVKNTPSYTWLVYLIVGLIVVAIAIAGGVTYLVNIRHIHLWPFKRGTANIPTTDGANPSPISPGHEITHSLPADNTYTPPVIKPPIDINQTENPLIDPGTNESPQIIKPDSSKL